MKVTAVKQVFGFSVILIEFKVLNVSSVPPPHLHLASVMVTLITVCLYLLLIGQPVSLQL
jgi:hypothetical protein